MITYDDLRNDFTQTPNNLYTPNISLPAKGLYGELRSLIRTWKVFNTNLANRLGISLKTLDKYLDELIRYGWISRVPRRKSNGQFEGGYDYILHNSPNINTANLVNESVDNLTINQINSAEKSALDEQQLPARQNLPANKTNISNIKKTYNAVSKNAVVDNHQYSELEIKAAEEYTDSQKGVRDKAAYIAATLKHGWHKLILKKIRDKIVFQKYKEMDDGLSKNIYSNIRREILNSDYQYELVGQQILNPGKVILGHPSKNLSLQYFTTLYNIQLQNPELCQFEREDPEYAYLSLFKKLNQSCGAKNHE